MGSRNHWIRKNSQRSDGLRHSLAVYRMLWGRRIRQEELKLYYHGLLHLMNHLDMLIDPDHWLAGAAPPATHRFLGGGDLDQSAVTQFDGFFIPLVKLLQYVEPG